MDHELQLLADMDYFNLRRLPDGTIIGLMRMMFTTGLFVDINEHFYGYRYCYETVEDAIKAINEWNGENDPPGPWIKRKGLGNDKAGPGAKQYVRS